MIAGMLMVFFVMAGILALTSMVVAAVILAWQTSLLRKAGLLSCLAVVVDQGLPLRDEVGPIADGLLRRSPMKARRLMTLLEQGRPLVEALKETRLINDRQAIALGTAERAGSLGHALKAEAERLTRAGFLTSSVSISPTLTVVYFTAVPVVAFAILMFMSVYIVPKMKEIFRGFGVELPGVTVALISVTDLLVKYFYLLLPLGFLCVGGAIALVAALGSRILDLPSAIGFGYRRYAAPTLRAIAYAAEANRPLDDLFLADRGSPDLPFRLSKRLALDVSNGKDIWEALRNRRLIHTSEVKVLRSAQEVGNLPATLLSLADKVDEDRGRSLARVIEVAQPLIVLALGAVVLFINLGLFCPLIQLLNDQASGGAS